MVACATIFLMSTKSCHPLKNKCGTGKYCSAQFTCLPESRRSEHVKICSRDLECYAGDFCFKDKTQMGICVPTLGSFAQCDSKFYQGISNPCPRNYRCSTDKNVCEKWCSREADCKFDYCDLKQGVCRQRIADDQNCGAASVGDTRPCFNGSFCSVENVCVRTEVPIVTESCKNDTACPENQFCHSNRTQCLPLRGLNETCVIEWGNPCEESLICRNGLCDQVRNKDFEGFIIGGSISGVIIALLLSFFFLRKRIFNNEVFPFEKPAAVPSSKLSRKYENDVIITKPDAIDQRTTVTDLSDD